MTKRTMGQALDEAIMRHEAQYQGSEVYGARVHEHSGSMQHPECFKVELDATHFSVPLTHYIPHNAADRGY